jgi:hypothetical protein
LDNDPQGIANGNALYLDMLRYGGLEEQPGANAVAPRYERNFNICARIVQVAEPGERILIIYGSGHAFLLRHCLAGVPGWRLKEPNDDVPN